MMSTVHPGGMTAQISGTRGERIGRITDMVPTMSRRLIRTRQMPATASVRRAMVLHGAETQMERTHGAMERNLGRISRGTPSR